MKINKAYKFRLYPNKKQIEYIEGCFNACRYVYNVSLDCEKQLYDLGGKSNLSAFGLGYHLKYYKINSPWLKKYDALALEFEMANLSEAYQKFFKGGGFPKFKKKDGKQSFRTRQAIKVLDNAIIIPKAKEPIEAVIHRPIEGIVKQMTISRNAGGYYVSVMTEIEKDIQPVIIKEEIGVDWGVSHFLTLSNGEKIENPKFLRSEEDYMKKLQQAFSKAKKGSNNREKLKHKIAKLYNRIKNKRENFLHNESAKLVNNFDRIYVENLAIKNITASAKGTVESHGKNIKQKSGLNKSILDTSPATFIGMLSYKTKFSGKELVKVGKFFASSKLCYICGYKNSNLKLEDRNWICENCGHSHDRDENAAMNIKAEGMRSLIELK